MPEAETPVMDAPAAEAAAPEATPEPFSREFHPMSEQIPPALQALMQRALPVEGDTPVDEEPEPDAEPEKKHEPAKPAARKAANLGLAPDLTKKPDAAPPADDIEPFPQALVDTAKTPKAKADIAKFRDRYEAMANEVRQARTKAPAPADTAAAEALAAELEKLKAQHGEMSAQLEREALYRHPKFHQQFVGPRDKMMAQASEIVKEAGGEAEVLERALALPNKAARIAALDEIVGEISSTFQREQLVSLLRGIDEKNRSIEGVLKNSKSNLVKLEQDRKIAEHQSLVENERQMTALLGAARGDLADKMGLEVLHKTEQDGFEWWNKQVDDIDETAKHITFKLQPQEVPTVAYLAASAGAFRSLYQAENKARIAAETRLAEIEAAEPGLNGSRSTPKAAEGEFSADEDITKVAMARLKRGDFGR